MRARVRFGGASHFGVALCCLAAALGLWGWTADSVSAQQPSVAHVLAGRTVRVGAPTIAPTADGTADRLSVAVTLQNTGAQPLAAQPGDFTLISEGDVFNQVGAPAALAGQVAPGGSLQGTLDFELPAAAVPAAHVFYHSTSDGVTGTVDFNSTTASTATASTAGTTSGPPTVRAKIWAAGSPEPSTWMVTGTSPSTLAANPVGAGGSWDQAGTGETIDYACFAHATSTARGCASSSSSVNAIEDTFTRANQTGWGTSTNAYNVPNVAWGMDGGGAMSNVAIAGNRGKYGYPGAINQVGIATAGTVAYNGGDSLVEFSVSAVGHATPYVVQNACPDKSCYYGARLHTSQNQLEVATRSGATTTIIGSAPFTASAGTLYWMRVNVLFFAGSSTLTEHSISNGIGDPWGTAVTQSGNVWFAEPGCDFGSCSSSSRPGQIGQFVVATNAINLYTLPNIPNNQAFFLALDGSGNVWFTTPDNAMIGEFSPATKTFVGQWAVTAGTGPWDLTFNKGMIWYTEHLASAVGEFDPSTHTHVDIQTPSAGSNPYGIVGNDAVNGNLVWFTENTSTVARIGVVDTGNGNAVSEYLIRSQLPPGSNGLTPHLIALSTSGRPWWTEGWVHDIGSLNPAQATAGSCGTTSGDCAGVTEYAPPSGTCNNGSHLSGIHISRSGLVWSDDSLSAQLFSFNPPARKFASYALSNCNAHPHDGLTTDFSNNVWSDEEFSNTLGTLVTSVAFGTNMPLFDANEQMITNAATRSILAGWHLPWIRMPFRPVLSDAVELSALQAIKGIGARPMVIVQGPLDSNALNDDLHELQLTASVFGANPVYVEYDNEADRAGITSAAYTSSWNATVPTLKSKYPSYKFIGPVLSQWHPTYVASFVTSAKPAPDFISWHEYVCNTSETTAYCMQHIANWAVHVSQTNSAETAAVGHTVPFFISEWNMDSSADTRYGDPSVIGPFTTNAIKELESQIPNGLAGAIEYCADSHESDFQLIDATNQLTPQGQTFHVAM